MIWQIIKVRITPLFMGTLEQRHGDKVQDFDMLDVDSQSNKEIPTENTVLGFRRLYPRSVLICILCCSTYIESNANKECWIFIQCRVFLFRLAYTKMEAYWMVSLEKP